MACLNRLIKPYHYVSLISTCSFLFRCLEKQKITILIVVTILFHGCVSTRYTGTQHCAPYLKEGDKILVSALPSTNWEYQVNLIRKELKGRNVKVLYAPEEEFNLRAAGVINPLDSVFYTQLMKKGITHLLLIREVDSRQGDVWDYKTPYELSLELNPYHYYHTPDNEYKTVIAMKLLSLNTKQLYSFTTETSISGVSINDKHGGSNDVNAGSIGRARNIAIKKGVRRIAKNCR